ncbi:hypothetical protein ANO11243_053580 [Dothideomycetidae sp. 11243]|nr:hypothetical protein ANO11243_053580 [fungal sp. No.11243]
MDYSSWKVTELKDELKKRGIPTTKLPRKQDIIARLTEDDLTSNGASADAQLDAEGETSHADENGADKADTAPDSPSVAEAAQENAPGATITANDSIANKSLNEQTKQPITLPVESGDNEPSEHSTPVPTSLITPAESITQEETAKRKRRSPSPAPSAASVTKKLKTAEDIPVHLSDADMSDVAPQQGDAGNTSQPDSLGSPQPIKSQEPDAVMVDGDSAVSASLHPPTAALYIRNLIRPLNVSHLRSHIDTLANSSDSIQMFHLDSLRTHALVLFDSAAVASQVRSQLHDSVFPPEPTRKPLWVDFIPPDSLPAWIKTEEDSAGRAPKTKRWEIRYSTASDGSVTANLVEADNSESKSNAQLPPPSAPTAPRAARESHTLPPKPNVPKPRVSFPLTRAEPALYYRPVSADLADERLDTLSRLTSNRWDPRADHDRFPSGAQGASNNTASGRDQLHRYTFQDDRDLVDGGPEYGGGRAFHQNRGRGNRGGGNARGGYGGGGGGNSDRRRDGVPRGGDRYVGAAGSGGGSGYGGPRSGGWNDRRYDGPDFRPRDRYRY